jgi:hypothetical protein
MITPLVKFMNENPNLEVSNNFIGQHYINPLDILLQEYNKIMDSTELVTSEKQKIIDIGFINLEKSDTIEAKRT